VESLLKRFLVKEETEMANTLKVTLVKSPIGAVPKHKKTIEAMGLRKMNKTVELPDNDATRGMIKQVSYMVKVEEA
jgi:large subunit ribosomal protein L30